LRSCCVLGEIAAALEEDALGDRLSRKKLFLRGGTGIVRIPKQLV
jgi:hypothetical protein